MEIIIKIIRKNLIYLKKKDLQKEGIIQKIFPTEKSSIVPAVLRKIETQEKLSSSREE